MKPPEPLPGTHLARVDCNGCGAYVLADPRYADLARCYACWMQYIDEKYDKE